MMERWNMGMMEDCCRGGLVLALTLPVFQYSNIPFFHGFL